ncbi:thioredoxin-dependent thiol peroxidase [Paenibacillus sp. MSJ-34]|uniref:thioredoxin-dependent thiol peroxidase n=1 Tax=Paenibacillus sp. MSJ-34 TaxID=2841529 RepID=UPI001C11C3EF|nr:thioredoxin-dependent thiol peroxidase [Paenibacillus sp. MSJ-34]MBU5443275.1 thioredoxin-dependent thiol peroxidase [Paenibacillus sp. MSJ-34]
MAQAQAQVAVGQPVPDFRLPASNGKTVALSDYRGKKVVVYFYPKDMTPGCTIEAGDFRDAHEEFTNSNTVVLGISPDDLPSHEKFIETYNLPFLLLADTNHEVCDMFGVWRAKDGSEGVERSTFLIDEQGKLLKEWRDVQVEGHTKMVLEAAK